MSTGGHIHLISYYIYTPLTTYKSATNPFVNVYTHLPTDNMPVNLLKAKLYLFVFLKKTEKFSLSLLFPQN